MNYISSLFLVLLCFSCTSDGSLDSSFMGGDNGAAVTEQTMDTYLKIFKELKNKTPNALELINENEVDNSQQEQMNQLEKIVQNGGMSLDEFVAFGSKVGTIFSISEANMGTYNDMKDMAQDGFQDMANSIQEMLDDPDVPADKKEELRAALAQAQTGKVQMGDLYEINREKFKKNAADAQKKLNKIASDEEINLVKKYQKELEDAFSGISRPRIQGSL